jgi:hypothetical protein
LARWSSRRQVCDEVSREAANAVLGDFDLAGRTALVGAAEADTARAFAPALRQLARCVVAANGRGAAIILQGMAPHRSAALRRALRELAALDIRLDVVQVPQSAERALGAALGAVAFFAQRRRCS